MKICSVNLDREITFSGTEQDSARRGRIGSNGQDRTSPSVRGRSVPDSDVQDLAEPGMISRTGHEWEGQR